MTCEIFFRIYKNEIVYFYDLLFTNKRFFERTNQIIKIIIKFLITNNTNFNFVLILSILQTQLNNAFNVVIDLFVNKINNNFKIRDAFFNFFIALIVVNLLVQKLKYRQKVVNVTTFANVKIKIYYNVCYTLLLFKTKNYLYFRLHHKYQLSTRFNKKNFNNVAIFFVKKRVDCLIYKLKFSLI